MEPLTEKDKREQMALVLLDKEMYRDYKMEDIEKYLNVRILKHCSCYRFEIICND